MHLVYPKALRKAHQRLGAAATFEQVLAAAEQLGHAGAGAQGDTRAGPAQRAASRRGSSSDGAAGGAAPLAPRTTLLSRPGAFCLYLVWESSKVGAEPLRETLEALGPAVNLAAAFATAPSFHQPQPALEGARGAQPGSGAHQLVAVVCFADHHYTAFARSEELGGAWLHYSDLRVSLVGGASSWRDVAQTMLHHRLQPSLLVYADC